MSPVSGVGVRWVQVSWWTAEVVRLGLAARCGDRCTTLVELAGGHVVAEPIVRCGCGNPRHATSVTHERPPPAMGQQARQADQQDVPMPQTDTHNVFLC